jgi:multicomponent Na+:H+ antiporter subunit F
MTLPSFTCGLTLGVPSAFALALLSLALFLAFGRLAQGPSLPDRVVALDLISTLTVGIIAVYSIATKQPAFLDAAIVVALVTFLATVGFARYVEQRAFWREEAEDE